jgi:ATP-dependent helicase/nuclease subunit B
VAASKGVFNDDERRLMIESGIAISAPSLDQVVLERYFTYFALTLPSSMLSVSYCRSDFQGREMLPSIIVSQLHALFSDITENTREPDILYRVQNAQSALSHYAAYFHAPDTPEAAALRMFLSGRSGIRERLDKAAVKTPHTLRNTQSTRALFGTSMRLSPSRVERYHSCPYSFFASDGLRLKKRKKVEFTPLESGNVIHHVLHVCVQKYQGRGLAELTQKQLEKEVRSVIGDYISARVEKADDLPVRFRYLFERLCGMLSRLLKHIGDEFAQSRFDPVAYEMPIRLDGDVEPLNLKTADGTSVVVEGIIDRVDVMTAKNGVKYVRVVDYKSGRKDFKLQDILSGLNLQMLLYLFTLQENGKGPLENVLPAGVLYMPVREAFITAGRDTTDAEMAGERRKNWRMSGLLLEDAEILAGMEADMAGIFIPAKLKKDGSLDSYSSVADLSRMGRLGAKVQDMIIQMAAALSQGGIAAHPVDAPDYPICAYCDYRALCGFEDGDAVRKIAKLDREKVFELLESEADDVSGS